jgi:hypothetical protein
MPRRDQALPQQLPGPAQPACPGEDPQQAVSPGPGMAPDGAPDRDECADMSFLRLPLPQRSQYTVIFSEKTSTSATWPQSAHKKSKSGMSPSYALRGCLKTLDQVR